MVERTPLQKAIDTGDVDACRQLIAQGASVTDKDVVGNTPLHDAAQAGQTEICRLFLTHGAELEAKDDLEQTALHEAVWNGHFDAVCWLINSGADIHTKDTFGTGMLSYAVRSQNEDVCRVLIDAGIDVNAKDDDQHTPLHNLTICASEIINPKVGKLLIESGADLDAADDRGWTALDAAVRHGSLMVCRLLVEAGAGTSFVPPSCRNDYLTPFQKAVYVGYTEIVEFFCRHCGEDPAQRTVGGRTMAQVASKDPAMKELLRSLKTELCVRGSFTEHGVPRLSDAPARTRGMSAL